jgi:hypothetical protein
MMDFDLFQRPIEEIQRECRGLLVAVFERGWTVALIAHVFMARVAKATGEVTTKELLWLELGLRISP